MKLGNTSLCPNPVSEVRNTYAVIKGQAQIVRSETQTWGAKLENNQFVKVLNVNDSPIGLTDSTTYVDYKFNSKGQLVGAVGGGKTITETKVRSVLWNDANGDGVRTSAEETTVYDVVRTEATLSNRYVVIRGRRFLRNRPAIPVPNRGRRTRAP